MQWLVMFGLPVIVPEQAGAAVLAGVVGALAVLIWWLFFSRAPWPERLGAIVVMVVAVAAASRLVHESIANGMMGFMLYLFAAPVLSLGLVVGAVASRGLSSRRSPRVDGRRDSARVRSIDARPHQRAHWRRGVGFRMAVDANGGATASCAGRRRAPRGCPGRGTDIARSEPLDVARDGPIANPPENHSAKLPNETATTRRRRHSRRRLKSPRCRSTNTEAAWPGFRGPARDSVVRGVRIETDWSRTPPVELWRKPIGPGWSSFAVAGDRFFTQEQRGDDEIVSAYDVKTGEPVWRHRDAARFWESNAGAGPRATPTLSNGRVYTLGATGILNALDARDGSVIWSRNAATDTGTKVPDWGIASSPLVVGDVVIAATAGSLAAYDVATGKPRWLGPKDGWGYSSPQLATIDGVAQIVLVNGPGVIGVSPSDGAVLWKHAWGGDSIVQPAVLAGGDLLVGSGSGLAANSGMLRVNVAHEAGGWIVKERWTSTALKPYFNDFVVHHGHAFGFDGSILACIDLADGTRKWKGRTLRPRPARPAGRPEHPARAVGRRRAGARVGDPR